MGTPDFAVAPLQALIDHGYDIVAVYSQPPRPKGRGHKVQPSPVHELAAHHNLPVYTPNSFKNQPEAVTEFQNLDLDIAVVAAYGLILPETILDAPRHGCLNIHASLLPRWRGASPIQHAIWKGDSETGITIMQMEKGLDTGPMISKKAVKIRPQTTATSLHDELSALGAAMIVETLIKLHEDDALQAEFQDDALSCYAPMLNKNDGRIEWTQGAQEIDRQIRALNPWPGVFTHASAGKRLKILEAETVSEACTQPPGTIIDHSGHIACGNDTVLRLIKIQPESKSAMDIASAFNGGYLKTDEILN